MNWFVYIVECSDKSLYTGITPDLQRRISLHNTNLGAKYVRGKLPVVLVYQEQYSNRSSAAKREREIKGWKRQKKLKLMEEFTQERVHHEERSDEGPIAQR